MKDSEAAVPADVANKPTAVAQKTPATAPVKKAVSTAKPSNVSTPDKTALATRNIN
jgi:hypothetical protein